MMFQAAECRVDFTFFFQAEDGIRDRTVTGVQTCALPISSSARPCARRKRPAASTASAVFGLLVLSSWTAGSATSGRRSPRSEERRVGKECRSRWLVYL